MAQVVPERVSETREPVRDETNLDLDARPAIPILERGQ